MLSRCQTLGALRNLVAKLRLPFAKFQQRLPYPRLAIVGTRSLTFSIEKTSVATPGTQPLFTLSLMPYPSLRRTRFVCVSDTHNTFPNLPAGDVLIHAGDLTNQGSRSELQKTIEWLQSTDFEVKIVVAGNHDVTLDKSFYEQYGSYFHNQTPQNAEECRALFQHSSLLYLKHETTTVKLKQAGTIFKIFGSPFSPAHDLWAFGYTPGEAAQLWDQIPLDADVVVTHTPPKFHRDEHSKRGSIGCVALRETLWRVRPVLHVCGHVHESRGAESVSWDLTAPNVKYKEKDTFYWHDMTVGTKKQFKIDLTDRRANTVLHAEGSSHRMQDSSALTNGHMPTLNRHSRPAFPDHTKALTPTVGSMPNIVKEWFATRGLGGPDDSDRIDKESLIGRSHRTETCIVNAAHVGNNWPHKGGKKFNKPIVVDLLLPIAD